MSVTKAKVGLKQSQNKEAPELQLLARIYCKSEEGWLQLAKRMAHLSNQRELCSDLGTLFSLPSTLLI